MLIDVVILYFIFNTKLGQTAKIFARRNNFEKDRLAFVARKYMETWVIEAQYCFFFFFFKHSIVLFLSIRTDD